MQTNQSEPQKGIIEKALKHHPDLDTLNIVVEPQKGTTHNTEVEEVVEELQNIIEDYINLAQSRHFVLEGDLPSYMEKMRDHWATLVEYVDHQLQKAREEERRKVFLEVLDLPAVGINTIDREDVKSLHHSELDQLNK